MLLWHAGGVPAAGNAKLTFLSNISVARRGFGGTWCLSTYPLNRMQRLRVVGCQITLRHTPDDHNLHETICIPNSENDIFHLFTVYLSNLSVPQTKATGWTPPSGCQGAHLPTVFIHIQISVNWSSQRLKTSQTVSVQFVLIISAHEQ
jgi:hypothetical protein